MTYDNAVACEGCGTTDREVEQADGRWLCLGCFAKTPPRIDLSESEGAVDHRLSTAEVRGRLSPLSSIVEGSPLSSSLSLSHQREIQGQIDAGEDDDLSYGDAVFHDVEAGVLKPEPVVLPNVPEDASEFVQSVVKDFQTLAGGRLALGDDRPVIYSCRWVAKRLGASHANVSRALIYLVKCGSLTEGEPLPARDGLRGTKCFLPTNYNQGPTNEETT